MQRAGLGRIHHQHHERVIGNIPFGCDAQSVCGCEPEAWIKPRMTDDDDERAAGNLESLISRRDQLAAKALTLVFRKDRHRTERSALDRADNRRTVQDVTDDRAVHCGHKRQGHRVVRSQRVNNLAFVIAPERTPVDLANSRDIVRLLFPNIDRRQLLPPTCGKPRDDQEERWAHRDEEQKQKQIDSKRNGSDACASR